MGIKPLCYFPDSRLNKPTEPIQKWDSSLDSLIQDLWDTLYNSPGVGLAAPQIGVLKQVSVIDIHRSRNPKDQIVLINPELFYSQGQQTPREGCLSVPDWLATVTRFSRVKIKTWMSPSEMRIIDGKGFLALALQHELDHLSGTLFLDRITNIKTDLFRRKKY